MSTITAAVETPEQVDLSAATRLELVSAQWQMFLRYPLGSGHRGTAALSPRFLSSEYLAKNRSGEDTGARSSHNTYLTVLVEQGIPGVLLFAGLILWLARTSLVARRQLAVKEATGDMLELASVAAILGVVLVAGMFRDFIKAEIFIWGLALLAGIHCRSSGQPRVTAHESELVGSPKVALD
jgi:O-antigen ligase